MSEKAVGGWLPLIGEAIECASPKPPLSGEVARRNAETERSYQICDNLSGEPLGAAEWAHNMLWGILRLPRKMGRKGLKGLENRRKA